MHALDVELDHLFAVHGRQHGESGTFTLKRRTAGNLAVGLTLDVGTWGNSIAAFMRVLGLADGQGFKATLILPVSSPTACDFALRLAGLLSHTRRPWRVRVVRSLS